MIDAVPPAFALGFVLVLLSAFLFHAVWGKSAGGLIMSIVAALLGFAFGEIVARFFGHSFLMMGPAHMAHGLLGTWIAMAVARYLSS